MQNGNQRPTNNFILKSLPEEDFERLLPDLEKVELPLGKIIYHPDDIIKYVYFPEHSMISIVSTTAEGESVEIGVVGREGMAGIDVLLGVDSTPHETMVQLADGCYRATTQAIRKEFNRNGAFHDSILRYFHAAMIQIAQTAVCNRVHQIEQRLARWLLLYHDRAATDTLLLTQEFLAMMLGANRPSVTVAAANLRASGFISYRRGKITILDRQGLEDFTCECYAASTTG